MIKMNKRFLFPLASGITFLLLICGSLTIIENRAHAQLPGLLVSCGVVIILKNNANSLYKWKGKEVKVVVIVTTTINGS